MKIELLNLYEHLVIFLCLKIPVLNFLSFFSIYFINHFFRNNIYMFIFNFIIIKLKQLLFITMMKLKIVQNILVSVSFGFTPPLKLSSWRQFFARV